jgi:hypothetical protein
MECGLWRPPEEFRDVKIVSGNGRVSHDRLPSTIARNADSHSERSQRERAGADFHRPRISPMANATIEGSRVDWFAAAEEEANLSFV